MAAAVQQLTGGGGLHCFKQSAWFSQNSPVRKRNEKTHNHPREVLCFLLPLHKQLSPLQLHHLQSLKNTCTSSILYKSIIQNKAFHRVEYSCRVLSVKLLSFFRVHSNHNLMLFLLPPYKKDCKKQTLSQDNSHLKYIYLSYIFTYIYSYVKKKKRKNKQKEKTKQNGKKKMNRKKVRGEEKSSKRSLWLDSSQKSHLVPPPPSPLSSFHDLTRCHGDQLQRDLLIAY